jgi:peptidase M23-like protein
MGGFRLLVLFGVLVAPCLLRAAEIQIAPADYVILNPTNVDKGFSDFVVHTICIASGQNETLTLQGVKVEVLSRGQVVLMRSMQPVELVEATTNLAHAPFVEYVSGQLLDQSGLKGLFGRQVAFADSAVLQPSTALVAMRIHFSVNFPVDFVRVSAAMADLEKRVVTVTKLVPVHAFTPLISYNSPLAGTWLMQAVPGVNSHHRFNPSTEFAQDFFRIGKDGHVAHGDPLRAENFYGYGAPVLAAAAGTVVVVVADQNQDRSALVRKSTETMDHFLARVDDFHMKAMARNFRAANAGNLITIRHEHNGATEYTSYGHLRSGSVRVHLGDKVAQGQEIAAVGDTGDSAEVHLHFQVNTGADAFTSKSLPAIFSNLYDVDNNAELGRLVSTTQSPADF